MKDGILCFDKYNKAKIRIMWILKQNINYGYCNYAEQLAEGIHEIASSPTWRRMAHVSYGLISGERNFDKVCKLRSEEFGEFLLTTAIVEVNKELGNARSSDNDILKGFEHYKNLTFEQIKAYNPDVIIVSMVGKGECLKTIVAEIYTYYTNQKEYLIGGHTQSGNADVAWSKIKDKVFLWTYHPSYIAGITDNDFFDTVMRAYNEAIK